MTIFVTPAEIEQWRALLAEQPVALTSLDALEDCEGDLEDAALVLAIQAGQEPDTSDRWLEGLAKRWRHVLCQPELKTLFEQGLSPEGLTTLATSTELPARLVVPVAIYFVKTGVQNFCQPFEANFTGSGPTSA